jgi:1,4-alpha-glucan branching enzyme
VVHGKGSLAAGMPGDRWQQLATLRLLLAYQYTVPGKKLLFMGSEFAQWQEWDHDSELHWELLEDPSHAGVRRLVADLNAVYRSVPALHELDTEPDGFQWVSRQQAEESVLAFLRRDSQGAPVLVACNFTPVPRHNQLVGVPDGGYWTEVLNSDALDYGGSGQGNFGGVDAQPLPWHGFTRTLTLTLPPLGCVILRPEDGG